jgi:flagellar hook-length control protein FliK
MELPAKSPEGVSAPFDVTQQDSEVIQELPFKQLVALAIAMKLESKDAVAEAKTPGPTLSESLMPALTSPGIFLPLQLPTLPAKGVQLKELASNNDEETIVALTIGLFSSDTQRITVSPRVQGNAPPSALPADEASSLSISINNEGAVDEKAGRMTLLNAFESLKTAANAEKNETSHFGNAETSLRATAKAWLGTFEDIAISPGSEPPPAEETLLAAIQSDTGMINKHETAPTSPTPVMPSLGMGAIQSVSRASLPPVQIQLPIDHQNWNDELGNRIVWMVKQDVQSAQIRINPPQLGPIEVRVSMSNDQISIAFSSHHAAVRDTLEAAIPRLREMFGESGMSLADASVSQQAFSQQRQSDGGSAAHALYTPTEQEQYDSSTSNDEGAVEALAVPERLVDYYA